MPAKRKEKTMASTINELREKRAELADEAMAILNIAEKEKRELTDDEQKQWSDIAGDGGTLDSLDAKIEKAEKFEAEKKRLQKLRLDNRREAGDVNALAPNDVAIKSEFARHVPPALRAYKDPKDALLAGIFMAAVATGDERCKAELERRGEPLRMAQNEGTGSKGAYLVPTPMVNSIIAIRDSVGVATQLATFIGMSQPTLELPKESAGLTVYYPGEAGSITDSDVEFEKVKLEIAKRAARCLISNEVQADAVISMVDWVTQRMGYDFSYQRDNELINGNGTSTYGKEVGLLAALGSAGVFTNTTDDHDAWDEFDIPDFQATIAKLPEKWFGYSPAWLCSRTFHAQTMAPLAVAAGGNQIVDIQNGAIQQRFLGYPVIFTDQMPKTTATSTVSCLFGAFRQAVVIGDRNDMSMGVSEHAQWATDQLDVRVTHRYDILVHEGGDTSAAGAYVGLSTNS